MESLSRRYNKKLLEGTLNQHVVGIAQIADEESAVQTLQQQKFNAEGTDILLRRYKIRICSLHDDTVPVKDLPWAYGQVATSGLRGESSGISFYPINTFVTVFEDPQTGLYYIGDVHPNSVGSLQTKKAPGCAPASGFKPGSALFYVPDTHTDGSKIVPGSEWYGATVPSKADDKQDSHNEVITIPTACKPVNTAAINGELENLVKGIEKLRTGLTGKDSFLATSQNFLNSVQDKVNSVSKNISRWITWLIQEIRKFVLRKVNATINNLTGGVPLSQRYLINETTDKTLSLISCLFVQLLQNLESLISQFLNALIDKFLNTAQCLVENFISNFIGQLLGQIFSAINSILGTISGILGKAVNIINDVFDFVKSIINLLECKVKNVCPTVEKWNFLEGAQNNSLFGNLDFTKIFNDAQNIANSFSKIIDLPESGTFNFNFDVESALNNVLNGCGLDTFACGPPNVVFWGGNGSSSATGNAIIGAAGDILGVNITNPGNYTSAPFVAFQDDCGNGTGGYAIAVIGPITINTATGTAGSGTVAGGTAGSGTAGIGTTGGTRGGTAGIGTTTITGVTDVIIIDSGYGYIPAPNGDRGGIGRIYANRCQSVSKNVDGKTSLPYNPGEVITLYPGDIIRLPGNKEVLITKDFQESMIAGSIVHNRLVILKDMTGFDDSKGTDQGAPNQFGYLNDYPYAKLLGFSDVDIRYYLENQYAGKIGPEMRKVLNNPNFGKLPPGLIFKIKNMIGFDDSKGTDQGAPNQFGYENDYPYAKLLGFSDVDIRYYLENEYKKKIGPKMQDKLNDPNFGKLPKFYVTVTAPSCPPVPKPPEPKGGSLGDFYIEDEGFGFEPDDTLGLEPDNGAIIKPNISNGSIKGITIINPGIGFTVMPKVVINTNTGYNARFKPVLRFDNLGEPNIPPGTKIVDIVDCVGKV